MALQMDPGEILREYNAAAGKDKQIAILAEINDCRPMEIALCLREQGAVLTGGWKARLAAHDRKPQKNASSTPVPSAELEPSTEGSEKALPLTAGALREMLRSVPEDTPVQILGHAGLATSALFIVRADARGAGYVLRIQREG